MRTFVVGDIHGCYDEWMELLDRAGLDPGDQIVAVGDLVDRGPNTAAVLEFFRRTAQARSVMGKKAHSVVSRGATGVTGSMEDT